MKRTHTRFATVCLGTLAYCLFSSPVHAEDRYAPGELLVRFKPTASAADIASTNREIGCNVIRKMAFIDVYHLKITSRLTVKEAVERYNLDPKIEFAEPNYRIELRQRVPNNAETWPNDDTFDPTEVDYGLQWSLDNWGQTAGTVDADIDAPQMWRMITDASDSVIVAILDTGMEWYHDDLAANIWANPDEIPTNGIDDDDNNYIDDVRGWDFVDNDNDPDDMDDHGTHVGGIVGAVGNNGMGVTGVCWSVRLMPVRIINSVSEPDFIANACLGIDYALHEDAKIINASWGTTEYSFALRYAIERADDFGVLFVSAVGYGDDQDPPQPAGVDIDLAQWHDYPPEYTAPNIIAVTASDHDDVKLGAANYGAVSVDLAAPGVDIYSTVTLGDYDSMTGTSMAAPHVAGAAALCWSLEPGLTHLELKDVLLSEATSFNAADKEKKPAFQLGGVGEVLTEGRLRAAQNADFGDAPDLPYPTEWPPLGWGAIHLDCGLEWLGEDVSVERSATDIDGTDTDNVPNLVDNDGFDDGVTFFPPYFCKGALPFDQVDVTVTVSDPISGRYGGAFPAGQFLYLNSFFDFNNDGDWADVFTCVLPGDAPEHLLIQAVGGPGAFSVVNPLPDNRLVIDPSLWGGPPTRTSQRIELYFYSPPLPDVSDTIWSRFRVEYDDQIWPTPDHKYLGTEFDYSLFGEVEDYVFEQDYFPDSEATIDLDTPLGADTITLTGPTTVLVDISGLADVDTDGLEEVTTEIVQLELTGTSGLLGPVTVRIRPHTSAPFERSTGLIEELSNDTPGVLDLPPFAPTGSAFSFFDVFFEIEVGGEIYHNDDPKHMETVITYKPPAEGEMYEAPEVIPLFDENGDPTGVSIGTASHTPDPFPPPPPVPIVSAESCMVHDDPCGEMCLPIGCADADPPYDNVEPRMQLGTPPVLKIHCDGPVGPGTASCSVSCVPNDYAGTTTVVSDGSADAEVQFSDTLPDQSCCTFTFTGGIQDIWTIVMLEADVNQDGQVSTADASSVKARLEMSVQDVGAQYDVNRDCQISTADRSSVKARLENVAPVPCLCEAEPMYGACCDPYTGDCVDDVEAMDCLPPFEFYWEMQCAELEPLCGNPGACCDDETAVCNDDVLELNCAGTRFAGGALCADFDPACGEYEPCEHSITMWDSYGDGWNGCYIDVYVNGEEVLSGVTIPSGAGPDYAYFQAGTGDEIFVDFICVSWCTEASYCVYDGQGAELGCATGGDAEGDGDLTVTGNCEPGSGDCCYDHYPETGCEDPDCEASVCSYESYCCDYGWDSICADEAAIDPACDCGGAARDFLYSYGDAAQLTANMPQCP